MGETCCNAYSTGNVDYLPSMEDVLYDSEYSMYNQGHVLDDLIYYQLFECD
jgi:hypothetical protein